MMKRSRFYAMAVMFLTSTAAHADMGVPMLAVTLPGMVLLLIPIILVEGLVIRRQLAVPLKRAFKASAWANLFSTLIGVPIAWGVLAILELGTQQFLDNHSRSIWPKADQSLGFLLQVPWLLPIEAELHWMVPAACLILLFPYFLASWWSERAIYGSTLDEVDSKDLWLATRNANLASYSGILVGVTLWLVVELWH